jgi:hypothetical protein
MLGCANDDRVAQLRRLKKDAQRREAQARV